MSKKIFLSIITPCYNSEKYIGRYLESILKQENKSIQLILVDDGSTDETQKKIFSYKEKIESSGMKLTYLYKENGGIGSAINLGLKSIEGDYFAWCDSDNFYRSDFTKICFQYLKEHPDCDILRHDGYMVKDDNINNVICLMSNGNKDKYNKKLFDNAILVKNFHFGCSILKTSSFDKVVENREIYESREGQNWQLLLPMFLRYDANYIDIPLFYFVIRNDSISYKYQADYEKTITKLDEHKKIILETIKTLDINHEYYYKMIDEKFIKIKINTLLSFKKKIEAKKMFDEYKKRYKINFKFWLHYKLRSLKILIFIRKNLSNKLYAKGVKNEKNN